jgi:hypothetical protein
MLRNFLIAGIVVILIGAGILYSVSSYITTGTPTKVINVTSIPHSIADVPFIVNGSSISIVFVFSSNLTDIYLINQSTFNGLTAYLSSNTPVSALSYVRSKGVNSSDVFVNNATAVKEYFQTGPSNSVNDYYAYAVIDSTLGSPSYNSVVNASVVYKAYSYSSWLGRSGEALVGVIAFIGGVALLIYGAVRKPKKKDEAQAAPREAKPKRKKKG